MRGVWPSITVWSATGWRCHKAAMQGKNYARVAPGILTTGQHMAATHLNKLHLHAVPIIFEPTPPLGSHALSGAARTKSPPQPSFAHVTTRFVLSDPTTTALSLPPTCTFLSFHSSPNLRSSPSFLHDRIGRHQKRNRPPPHVPRVAHRPLTIPPRSLDPSLF